MHAKVVFQLLPGAVSKGKECLTDLDGNFDRSGGPRSRQRSDCFVFEKVLVTYRGRGPIHMALLFQPVWIRKGVACNRVGDAFCNWCGGGVSEEVPVSRADDRRMRLG